MILGGLQKTTLIDYPGKIACTVFTVGCNFRCPFCYSGELVLPEKIKKQPKISEKDFFNFLIERKGLLDGCVLCGGEPTISEDLPEFCKKIKELGFFVKLDTNGSNPQIINRLIDRKLIDYIAMDIKSPKEKYEFYSGAKLLTNVEKSIKLLRKSKIDFEFRTTIAPGLKKEDIIKIADWIGSDKTSYFLQEFNEKKPVLNPKILNFPVLKREEIEEIAEEIKPKFKICKLR